MDAAPFPPDTRRMRTGLNILWFIFGGFFMGLGWWITGVVLAITIIGIPWARAAFEMGSFCFHPFGREVVNRAALTGRVDVGTGLPGFFGNVIWFVLAGWWLALGHVLAGLANCLSIIGIPFGIQHFKLAAISLAPIGKTVVLNELATKVRERTAAEEYERMRGN